MHEPKIQVGHWCLRLQEKTLEEAGPERAWTTLRRAPLSSDGLGAGLACGTFLESPQVLFVA